VRLAGKIDWEFIDGEITPPYSAKGRPGLETRFVIALLLLKNIYGLSARRMLSLWPVFPSLHWRGSSTPSDHHLTAKPADSICSIPPSEQRRSDRI